MSSTKDGDREVRQVTHRDMSVYAVTSNGSVGSVPKGIKSMLSVILRREEDKEYNRILDMLSVGR
jgi:hypothetical protein